MKAFIVIACTAAGKLPPIPCIAMSSAEAGQQVADFFDEPCGITVRAGGDHGDR